MNPTAAGTKAGYVAVPVQDPTSAKTSGGGGDATPLPPKEDFISSILGDPKKGDDSYTILMNAVVPKSYIARRRWKYVFVFAAAYLAAFGLVHVVVKAKRGGLRAALGGGYGGSSSFGYEGRSAVPDAGVAGSAEAGLHAMAASGRTITASTWNIAAINNNPFEYWITYPEDPEYERIMGEIEKFIESPGKRDVPVNVVFSDGMFDQLERRLDGIGWDLDHKVRRYWESDFRKRKIVSEFLKDPLLGSKRLASMPDRVTNTINVDGQAEPVCRPTVINQYGGDLSSVIEWWPQWEAFMFDIPLSVGGKNTPVYQMLRPISRSKYPDITEAEEKISLPLQLLCAAIFDSILVKMMNTVSTPDKWQNLKRTIVENLIRQKVPRTLEILQQTYASSDVITLQEVSVSFIQQASNSDLFRTHHIVAPQNPDAVRDQNSVILLKRDTFPEGVLNDITDLVMDAFPKDEDLPVANGDLLAINTRDVDGVPYVIASFHGDTNGLATKPVLDALVRTMSAGEVLAAHELIFGLDANTYERAKPGKQQDVMDFGSRYADHGLTSAWGDVPQPSNYTTFNARTYLQPQLNKACRSGQKREKGDVNPKDFILFRRGDLEVDRTWKDNTGAGGNGLEAPYVEDMAFPTLSFPSDHGILSTTLRPSRRFGGGGDARVSA